MLSNAKVSPQILTQEVLDSLNTVYAAISNKENLRELGGVQGLIDKLGLNPKTGLTLSQVELMCATYGDNSIPLVAAKNFPQLFLEAFSDLTIIILIAAAIISIIIEEVMVGFKVQLF